MTPHTTERNKQNNRCEALEEGDDNNDSEDGIEKDNADYEGQKHRTKNTPTTQPHENDKEKACDRVKEHDIDLMSMAALEKLLGEAYETIM